MPHRLSSLLIRKKHPVIDGAMATELEKLGVDTAQRLWSAVALLDCPEAVAAVHRAYFEAGADIATTNTYQANIAAFETQGLSHSGAAELIKRAVHIAVKERNDYFGDDAGLVAGSVGPYGAFLADGSEYTGTYQLSDAEFRDFHREKIELLLQAGADFLALETMPNALELAALLGLLADDFPQAEAWVSLSLADAKHLCDGTLLSDIAPLLNSCEQVLAVGVNCTALEKVEPALKALSALVNKPLLAYPNAGEQYDPITKTWIPTESARNFGSYVPAWVRAGVTLLGGCCRTTPSDIRAIVSVLGTIGKT